MPSTTVMSVGLASSSNGETVYVVGGADGPLELAGVPLSNPAGSYAFAAGFNPVSRTFLWAVAFANANDTSSTAEATAVAVDVNGRLRVAGAFTGNVQFKDPTTCDALACGFIATISPAGQLVSATPFGAATGGVVALTAAALDPSNGKDVVVGGRLVGSAAIDGMNTVTADSAADTLVLQIHEADQVGWVAHLGTSGMTPNVTAPLTGLTVDESSVYATGQFHGNVTFVNGQPALTEMAPTGFVWALGSGDGKPRWAHAFAPSTNMDIANATAVAAGSGVVAVAGSYSGPGATFDACPPMTASVAGAAFVTVLDAEGCIRGTVATSTGGTSGAIARDASGNLFLVGTFGGPHLSFGGKDTVAKGGGNLNLFAARLAPP
jgi:hypothetical protein